MEFFVKLIADVASIVLPEILRAVLEPWRWVCSSSYRAPVRQNLTQMGKIKAASVYLGGVALFLVSLPLCAGIALLAWWLLAMSPGAERITGRRYDLAIG
jgi:hypothetical protein